MNMVSFPVLFVDWFYELMWGEPRRPEKKSTVKMGKIPYDGMMKEKPKRARGKKGKFLADDPTTAFTNEAWVGGKAPKKGKKK